MTSFFRELRQMFFQEYLPRLITFSRHDIVRNYTNVSILFAILDFIFLLLITIVITVCYYFYLKKKNKNNKNDNGDDKDNHNPNYAFTIKPWLKTAFILSIINLILVIASSIFNTNYLDIAPSLVYIFALLITFYIIMDYKKRSLKKAKLKEDVHYIKYNQLLREIDNINFYNDHINYQNRINELPLKNVKIPKIDIVKIDDLNPKAEPRKDIVKTLSLDLDEQSQYFKQLQKDMIPQLKKIMEKYYINDKSSSEINYYEYKNFFKEGCTLDEFIEDCICVIQLYLGVVVLDFDYFGMKRENENSEHRHFYDEDYSMCLIEDYHHYTNHYFTNFGIKEICDMRKINFPKSLEGKSFSGFEKNIQEFILFQVYQNPKLRKNIEDCDNLYISVSNSFKNFKEKYFMESGIIDRGIKGEERVMDFFSLYDDELKYFNNVRLEEKFSFETDMLVLSEGGIYSIEVKNFSESGRYGLHITKDGQWLQVKDDIQTPFKDVMTQVNNHLILGERFINKKLKEKGIDEKIDLEPIIVIANDNIKIENDSDIEIVRISKLHTILKKGQKHYSKKLLDSVEEIIKENQKQALKYECIDYIKTFESMVKMYHVGTEEKEKLQANLKMISQDILSVIPLKKFEDKLSMYKSPIQ